MTVASLSLPDPAAVVARALAAGIVLSKPAARALAEHARAVLAANERLHLTAITQPEAFFDEAGSGS